MRPMEPLSSPLGLSVSLVLFNSELSLLSRTLSSLVAAAASARSEGHIDRVTLVVHDNSGDPAYSRTARQTMEDVIENAAWMSGSFQVAPDNSGYGGGHNAAASGISADLHLVLNPDVDLAEDALTRGIRELIDNPDVALVAPRVEGDDGNREFLCRRYPSVLVLLLRAFAPAFIRRHFTARLDHYEMRDVCDGDATTDVELASGCFMLMRSDAFNAVGGFDDRYFLYFEDYDLSMRLAELGKLRFQPAMAIVHHGGYAASKGWRHIGLFARSGYRFFSQYGWRWI